MGWGTVGVGGDCEVVGGAEGDESVLETDEICEEYDDELILAAGADCLYEFEVGVGGEFYRQLAVLDFLFLHLLNIIGLTI